MGPSAFKGAEEGTYQMVEITVNAVINGLFYGSLWGLVALGFTLVFGVMDFVNFAQGFFVLIFSYLSYFLFTNMGIDPYVSLVIVIPTSFLLGVLLYKTVGVKLIAEPHSSHIIVTLGICFLIENILLLFFGGDLHSAVTGYSSSTYIMEPIIVSAPRMWAALVVLLCLTALYIFMKYTDYGKSIRAAADNRRGASISGIFVDRVYILAFGLSTILAGIAGAVMIPFYLVSPFTGHELLGKAFAAVVIGGLGSISGAMVGGLIIGIVESVSSVYLTGSLGNALVFLIVIFVLVFKPSGLLGEKGE
jgi:branched-chain amino acid transport system permease protein